MKYEIPAMLKQRRGASDERLPLHGPVGAPGRPDDARVASLGVGTVFPGEPADGFRIVDNGLDRDGRKACVDGSTFGNAHGFPLSARFRTCCSPSNWAGPWPTLRRFAAG